jgi:hypothetical protein
LRKTRCLCSKGEAVATQTPEIAKAGSGGLDADQELIGGMETALRLALSGMLVLEDRNTGASSFANV